MAVYFIQAGAGGPIKIGVAKDVRRRIANLQISNAAELTLLRAFVGGEAEERVLHERFAEYRIAGEWFHAEPDVVSGEVNLPPFIVESRKRRGRKQPSATLTVPETGSIPEGVIALLSEIDAFLAGRSMAESTFGLRSVNDGKFVNRLRTKGRTTFSMAERVRAFIAAHRSNEAA